MNHETLKALYQLDVAEVGEEEAAKRWEFNTPFFKQWSTLAWTPTWHTTNSYRRKPGLPWPKVMLQQPEISTNFDSWWYASKYCQVGFGEHKQIAADGWNAAAAFGTPLECRVRLPAQPKEKTLNTEMNGKQVKRIWWNGANGDESMTTEGQRTLMLAATYHDDRDEFWVVQYEDMVEVARHNCKYIATIEWA